MCWFPNPMEFDVFLPWNLSSDFENSYIGKKDKFLENWEGIYVHT